MIAIRNGYKNIVEDKTFTKKCVNIAIPIAAQGLLNTLLNLVDTLMIGKLGVTTIAAVGLANKVFFVFSLLIFGIVSGSGILTAQYWGKQEIANIKRVLGISLIMGVSASFLFLLPSLINPQFMLSIFTTDADTISIGASYLMIVAISYPITAVTNSYISLLRGINEVKAPVAITVIAICIKLTLNYMMIFGNFGAPKLGVTGAAIATIIARIIECLSLLSYVYLKKGPAAAKIKELLAFNKEFIKKYFTTVLPVMANEFMWGLGVTIYSMVYGRMGNAAVAAITITQTVEEVLMVAFQGISAATAVILGNELGANHLKKAERYATNFIYLQFAITIIIAVLCFFIRWPMIRLFEVDAQTGNYISKCFLVFIIYMPFKMYNYVNIVGILRSGGDTKAALFLDCSGVWFIGIPLAFLGGLVLDLDIYLVYGMVMVEEVYKFILGFKRYKQKKWLKNIVAS